MAKTPSLNPVSLPMSLTGGVPAASPDADMRRD